MMNFEQWYEKEYPDHSLPFEGLKLARKAYEAGQKSLKRPLASVHRCGIKFSVMEFSLGRTSVAMGGFDTYEDAKEWGIENGYDISIK